MEKLLGNSQRDNMTEENAEVLNAGVTFMKIAT